MKVSEAKALGYSTKEPTLAGIKGYCDMIADATPKHKCKKCKGELQIIFNYKDEWIEQCKDCGQHYYHYEIIRTKGKITGIETHEYGL